ncbi:tetratricopeptide repeat protein [Aromatoleum diolicum]|uniref:Tetratricopeptide repeat protein n=1 Tax=Aromatoleum diolicum TaxID=75796 RepID=A0ABX1QFV2_9RHOO|nr:tetratricopeptide repeat protein [Aromatoleum diolicum]NMG77274.1 tetratricopeptide repeat protein [Aromatoleum diolicum]
MTNTARPLLRAVLVLLLLGLIALAYHEAPQNGFHLDDANNIVTHGPIHMTEFSVDALARAAREGALPQRSLANVSFALDWWRGGGGPSTFQITNILIHAATALAVLALILQLLRRNGAPPTQAWLAATAATAAWAVHPIQVQAVTYIVQRMASLAALFILIAVVAYVHGRQTQRGRIWYPIAVIAAVAAWLSKENAYILPALLLLAEYTLCREPAQRLRSKLDRLVLALPVVLIAYVVIDIALLRGPLWQYLATGYANRDFTLGERLLTQPRVIFFHLGQILWPLPERFSIEHDFPLSRSLWHPWTTPLAIAGLFAWIAGGAWLALRSTVPVAGFLLLWIPATLAIESSVVALEIVFEHRMYLASAGLAGLLALALQRLARTGHAHGAVLLSLGLVAGLLYATLSRVPVWRNPVTLYEHAANHAPQSPRAWGNLATAYETENRSNEAIAAYSRALDLAPRSAIAYLNRGSSYRKIGRPADAAADYRRFIALEPQDFRGHYALGALLLASGEYAGAETSLQRALALAAHSPLPLMALARLYVETDRPESAINALREARSRDPAVADIGYFDLLGIANARTGRFDAAVAAFTAILRADPTQSQALLNRAYAYLRQGQPLAALADFDHSVARRPNDAHAQYGRAESLNALGREKEALDAALSALAIEPGHARARHLAAELSRHSRD